MAACGSVGGGLQRIDRDGKVRTYGLKAGLPGLNPWVVAVAPDASVYAATYAPGLYRKAAGAERFAPVALPRTLSELPIWRLVLRRIRGSGWVLPVAPGVSLGITGSASGRRIGANASMPSCITPTAGCIWPLAMVCGASMLAARTRWRLPD